MDKEGKGILKENREGKGLPIIPYPYPPYKAGHIYAHTCPITAPIYGHVCAHTCPIAAPMWPMYTPYMAHICAHTCPIAAPVWPIYARIYAPLSGTKIRTIRKAVKKRQALCLIWTSLLALASGGKNGPYTRAATGHIWGQEWAIYKSSNGPYMGAGMGHVHEQQRAIYGGKNGPCTRVIIGHICAHTCPIAAPIYGHIYAHICPIDTLIYGLCICLLLLPNVAYLITTLKYGPYMPPYMAYCSAYYCASPN